MVLLRLRVSSYFLHMVQIICIQEIAGSIVLHGWAKLFLRELDNSKRQIMEWIVHRDSLGDTKNYSVDTG